MHDQCTPSPSTKTCTKCGEPKPLTEFHRHPQHQDGHASRCKVCVNAYVREYGQANKSMIASKGAAYRLANHEAVAASKAAWYLANREQRVAASRRNLEAWRLAHPDQARLLKRVHETVRQAIRRGTLVRPDRCERCGAVGWIEAAHIDYSQPLDVRWLCRPCHRRWDHADPKLR